jgi:hypothetical protein
MFFIALGWNGAPYIATTIGGLSLKSPISLATLLILAVGLIIADVGMYATTNSRDWYVGLAPLALTPLAGVCYLLAFVFEKAST